MAVDVVTLNVCYKCDQPIEPGDGLIIHGNVYGVGKLADDRGGIIGNAFPDVSGGFTATDVDEYAYHTKCLFQRLVNAGGLDLEWVVEADWSLEPECRGVHRLEAD